MAGLISGMKLTFVILQRYPLFAVSMSPLAAYYMYDKQKFSDYFRIRRSQILTVTPEDDMFKSPVDLLKVTLPW